MNRILWTAVVVIAVGAPDRTARADDQAVKAVLDKAVKALGGEPRLAKAGTYLRKTKGTISFNGNESTVTVESTVQGLDHYRSVLEGDFGGNPVRGVTVLDGDKGWRKFGDNKMDFDSAALANEKRNLYLQVIPVTILPLTGKGFKLESVADETINDKPAALLKVTGPEGKDFTIAFSKETGLPVRVVARVLGFQGQEFTQEVHYSEYREIDGIQRAMKIESKRDGQTFMKNEVAEYKVLEKVDPQTFAEPQ
jgi:hypothetical protein